MGDVRQIACEKIVDADDRTIATEKLFSQVRPDETGGAGDHYPLRLR
jgi:hypothetical protein